MGRDVVARARSAFAARVTSFARGNQRSSVSGLTANMGRPSSGSGRGDKGDARGAATVDACGATGGTGLLAGGVPLFCDGEGAMGGSRSAAGASVRTSRERFVWARGFSSAASSRTRLRYVRRAATETGRPRSESIAATAVQLYPLDRSARIWGASARTVCCLLSSFARYGGTSSSDCCNFKTVSAANLFFWSIGSPVVSNEKSRAPVTAAGEAPNALVDRRPSGVTARRVPARRAPASPHRWVVARTKRMHVGGPFAPQCPLRRCRDPMPRALSRPPPVRRQWAGPRTATAIARGTCNAASSRRDPMQPSSWRRSISRRAPARDPRNTAQGRPGARHPSVAQRAPHQDARTVRRPRPGGQ